jgi:DnaJ family protein C protein 7
VKRALSEASRLLKMSKRKDYYKILGITKSASDSDIKKAYRKMALLYHPDKQSKLTDEERLVAEAKFKEIGEAYTILSDPRKKQMFDSGMDIDGSSASDGMSGMGGGVPMDDILRTFFANGSGGHPGFGGHGFGGHGFGGGHPGFGGGHGFSFNSGEDWEDY